MSDFAPAFDEFLIRSEPQIAARCTGKFKNYSGHSGKPVGVGSAEKYKPRLKNSTRKEHTYVNPGSVGDVRPPVSTYS